MAERLHFVKMNGREVFKFATRVLVSSAEAVLTECGLTIEDVDVYVPHQANVRIIEHARQKLGIPEEKTVIDVDRYGNTSSGSIPLALADAKRRRAAGTGQACTDDGNGCRAHVGLRFDRMDQRRNGMSGQKIAFCFPARARWPWAWAREIALAVPEAMDGLPACERGLRARPRPTLLRGARGRARPDRGTAAGARRRRAWPCSRRCAREGYEPDVVVGHSVGEFAALAAAQALSVEDAIVLVRERGLAMAEAARENPGSMAAILGPRGRGGRGRSCRQIAGVWPANYNCPGQIVISGAGPGRGRVLQRGPAPGRRLER